MPFLGAHLSIAGGIPKAVERAEAAGCEALQIFTKSVGQWKARVLDDSEVARVPRRRLAFIACAPSSRTPAICRTSRRRIRRCATSRSPRSAKNSIGRNASACSGSSCIRARPTKNEGLPRIAAGLTQLLRRAAAGQTMILLEHTAGQGNNLGHRFEHLHTILSLVPDSRPRRASASAWTPVT